MPRKTSWAGRLKDIHARVNASAQEVYTRQDLERLFKVKTAAAKKLALIMPRNEQGNMNVIQREGLLSFLGGALDAEDFEAYIDRLQAHPPKPMRSKIRIRRPADFLPRRTESLNENKIWLNHGSLEMLWSTKDDFFSKMFMLLEVVQLPDFERRYCDPPPAESNRKNESLEADYYRAVTRYLGQLGDARKACLEHDADRALKLIDAARKSREEMVTLSKQLGQEIEPDNDEYLAKVELLLRNVEPAPPSSVASAVPGDVDATVFELEQLEAQHAAQHAEPKERPVIPDPPA